MPLKPVLRRHWPLSALLALGLLVLLWGMLAPLGGGSHELLLEFPRGVGPRGLTVPREIRLTRGVQDVLLVRNHGDAALVFGPARVGPGRTLRLAFDEEGGHVYACPAVAGGLVRVRVVAAPGPGWTRLRWRLGNLHQAVRYLPIEPPRP